MLTSYEVGSIFKIVDQGTPTLLKLHEGFDRLSRKITEVQLQLAEFGKGAARGLNSSLGNLDKKLAAVAEKAGAANKAMVESFGKMDVAVDGSIKTVDRLTRALGEAAAASKGLGRLRLPGGAGGGDDDGGGDSGGAHRPRRHRTAAHEVGLEMGFGGMIGAGAVVELDKSAFEKAAEFAHVQQQMRFAGFTPDEIAKSSKTAWDTANKLGLNVTDVMSDIKEIRQPFGSVDEVLKFLDPLEKMRVVLNAVSEGKGNSSKEAVYEMVRAGELKGLNGADDYLKYFDDMTKVISATGGKVGPKEFMQATKYSRLSALGMNEEYYTKYLPTMIQALGASGAGTANAALFGTLIQGKASGRSVEAMKELGLIGDMSKVYYKKGTKDIAGFHSGAIVDSELLTANPFAWAKKDLLPMMEKKFGDLSNEQNRAKAIDNLGDFFGNRMSAQAVGEMLFRMKSFDRDAKMNPNAFGTGQVDELLQHDPTTAMNKFSNSWTNLLNSLGNKNIDTVVKSMNGVSDVFTAMNKWATANPTATKLIGEAMIGLAGGLAAIGAAGVVAGAIALAPAGAIGVAVAGIAGAITGLAALNWGAVSSGLKSIWDTLEGWANKLDRLLGGSGGKGPADTHALGMDALPQAYHGSGFGDLLKTISYSGGGGVDAPNLPGIYNTGTINIYANGAGGGGGSGGGIMTASYETGGGSGRAFNVPAGVGGGPVGGGIVDAIMNRAGGAGFNTRGVRNLNPGNIGWGAWARAHGATGGAGSDTGHLVAVFPSFEAGYAAMGALALSKYGGGARSIDQLIAGAHGWTPGNHAAAANVARMMGISPFGDAQLNDPSMLAKFKAGLSVQELGPAGARYARDHLKTAMPPPPPPRTVEHHITVPVHLDGKVMARVVTKHQTRMAAMPHAIGGQDDYGSWASPGTTMMPA